VTTTPASTPDLSSRPEVGPAAPDHAGPSTARGVALLLGSASSTNIGAALGAQAFFAIGPAGVVAVRQVVAAAVLLPVARPRLRTLTRAQVVPTLALGLVFAVMNLGLYTAIDRVGLGLAVTLEFLGPLGVALLGSRGRRELALAVLAGIGVYVLVLPGPSSDLVGIGAGLVAAACWAAYILLNRTLGQRLPGLQAPALASGAAALAYTPVLVWLALDGRLWGTPLLLALGTGLLSSVVPYAVDLTVLRTVPPRLFGVLMSAQPGIAALAGLVLLGQALALHEVVGIVVVAGTNALAVATARPGPRPPAPTRPATAAAG
jgi:inner membrane transporter RhtA